MLERKQQEIDRTLQNMEASLASDIAAGLVDIPASEEKLLRGMTPEEKTAYHALSAEARTKRLYAHLIEQRRQHLGAWRKRLHADSAMDAMRKVCTRFKRVGGTLRPWKGDEKEWKTLAQTLQGDADNRRKILYFRDVAVGWMEATDVDVLSRARVNEPWFSQRRERKTPGPTRVPRNSQWFSMAP